MSEQTGLLDKLETQSSVFEKVTPEARGQINQAIVDRSPPTYRGVYEKFGLAKMGVSFHAFYRYARRLRFNSAALELAELTMPEGTDLIGMLPQIVAHRLLEAASDEAATPRTIQRLADAWRVATATLLALQRQKEFIADAARKQREHDSGCFRKATSAFTDVLKQHLANLEAAHPSLRNSAQTAEEGVQSPEC